MHACCVWPPVGSKPGSLCCSIDLWVLAFLLMPLCSCPSAHAFLFMQTHKVVKELGRHTDLRTAGECFAAVLRLTSVFWHVGACYLWLPHVLQRRLGLFPCLCLLCWCPFCRRPFPSPVLVGGDSLEAVCSLLFASTCCLCSLDLAPPCTCTVISSAVLVGGDSMEAQFAELAAFPDILVATPGALLVWWLQTTDGSSLSLTACCFSMP